MNKQEKMQFFFEIFDASLPRLGPGDDVSTRRALSTVLTSRSGTAGHEDTTELRILDLGCGNGAQTKQLATSCEGTILALDKHKPFLDELNRRAETWDASATIETCPGDMNNLELDEGSFDLIWSEGALSIIMGFRNGLEECFRLLVPGGALAVTELCWFENNVPGECRTFFDNEYPAMVDVDANMGMIEACGFEILDHFLLPELAWLEMFYEPLEARLSDLRGLYATDTEKLEMIEKVQLEIDIYRKYSSFYGYAFFVMRR